MKISDFKISLEEVEKLLRLFDLWKQKGIKIINDDGVSDDFKKASNKSSYFDVYKIAVRNFDYDFLLRDESFFQFEFKPNPKFDNFPEIRFAFFQNPQEYKTYQEYLAELDLKEEEAKDAFWEEYEQFLTEQELNTSATTIRFDTDLANYKPLIHSVAHIHIGFNNNIRIPTDKIISPLMFALFVIKQVYLLDWKRLIEEDNKDLKEYLKKAKKKTLKLDAKKWISDEADELFFS